MFILTSLKKLITKKLYNIIIKRQKARFLNLHHAADIMELVLLMIFRVYSL